jgi:hypothetical protein
MPGQLDSVFLPLASQLLQRFGEAMTLTKRSAETYTPATGAVSGTTATLSVYGYVDTSSIMQRDGIAQAGSQVVLLPAQDVTFTLEPGDTITIRGVEWTVADELDRPNGRDITASVRKVSAGSRDALLMVRVRR